MDSTYLQFVKTESGFVFFRLPKTLRNDNKKINDILSHIFYLREFVDAEGYLILVLKESDNSDYIGSEREF